MPGNLLSIIDKLYEESKAKNGESENSKYFYYTEIVPIGCKTTCSFLLKKRNKAKAIICVGDQRVYLSDKQILETILELDNDTVKWFIKQLVEFYKGVSSTVSFELSETTFSDEGIPCYPEEKRISLYSDSDIDINDLVFTINFILIKDRCWENYSKAEGFSRQTLIKYITLLDYFKFGFERSEKYLLNIGYPIHRGIIEDSKTAKRLFKKTETFDISIYS